MMEEIVVPLLVENKLCDHCFGRQFALLGFGLSNDERGRILKNAAVLELYDRIPGDEEALKAMTNMAKMGNQLAINSLRKKHYDFTPLLEEVTDYCDLCGGFFERLDEIVEEIIPKLLQEDFATFLVGSKFLPELIEKEDNLRAKYQITTGEAMKAEFSREIGKKIMKKTGKEPDFEKPDITIIIDLPRQEIIFQRRSLYIFGRYRKLVRTIPQTKWPCKQCNGKGCERCNFTGKLYQESVEELIAERIVKEASGSGSRFHGAGREDIDALMLGNGRPFVLEILEPKKRSIDLKKLQKIINKKAKRKVQVEGLTFSEKKKVQELKDSAARTRKTYLAKIKLEREVTEEQIKRIELELKGMKIKQRTPKRVLHRRADLERIKMVFDIKVRKVCEKELEAEITTEGGLYIKELISGDEGRTEPSFASILDCAASCYQLDVIKLHTKES